ncbi:hypothetical protein H9P43_000348 [Blastocladiella emersonii ATCC 22665]|nr:hypothetical protein H9P43_000348 [Blastocladiella emersonii ATCC 22665]
MVLGRYPLVTVSMLYAEIDAQWHRAVTDTSKEMTLRQAFTLGSREDASPVLHAMTLAWNMHTSVLTIQQDEVTCPLFTLPHQQFAINALESNLYGISFVPSEASHLPQYLFPTTFLLFHARSCPETLTAHMKWVAVEKVEVDSRRATLYVRPVVKGAHSIQKITLRQEYAQWRKLLQPGKRYGIFALRESRGSNDEPLHEFGPDTMCFYTEPLPSTVTMGRSNRASMKLAMRTGAEGRMTIGQLAAEMRNVTLLATIFARSGNRPQLTMGKLEHRVALRVLDHVGGTIDITVWGDVAKRALGLNAGQMVLFTNLTCTGPKNGKPFFVNASPSNGADFVVVFTLPAILRSVCLHPTAPVTLGTLASPGINVVLRVQIAGAAGAPFVQLSHRLCGNPIQRRETWDCEHCQSRDIAGDPKAAANMYTIQWTLTDATGQRLECTAVDAAATDIVGMSGNEFGRMSEARRQMHLESLHGTEFAVVLVPVRRGTEERFRIDLAVRRSENLGF